MPIVLCSFCKKIYFLSTKRFNENTKNAWKNYCSSDCLAQARKTGKYVTCNNPNCQKLIYIQQANSSVVNYCSSSCSAHISNRKRILPKKIPIQKPTHSCANVLCNTQTLLRNKFCSHSCQWQIPRASTEITKAEIIQSIKLFYSNYLRIPFKNEISGLYGKARNTFGTWNKAVIAAGFIPNPVKFAHKFIAKDGHHVDSLSEKIIDDWFFENKIEHQVHVPYPNQKKFSVDFLVGNTWIEFFGIYGEHKRYTELANEKILLSQKLNLNLIKLFPTDLKNLNTTFKSMFRTSGQ